MRKRHRFAGMTAAVLASILLTTTGVRATGEEITGTLVPLEETVEQPDTSEGQQPVIIDQTETTEQAETGEQQDQTETTETSRTVSNTPINESELANNIDMSDSQSGYGLKIDVTGETQKYEIIYSKDAGIPEIRLYSPGTNGNTSDGYVDLLTTSFHSPALISRSYLGMEAEGFDDLSLMTFYVSSETKQGIWILSIVPEQGTKECIVVKADTTPGWENLVCDYKTQPTKIIGWSLKESTYTVDDISNIIAQNSTIPEVANMTGQNPQPVVEETPEDPLQKFMPFIIGTLVILCMIVMIVFTLKKKKEARKAEDDKEDRIRTANRKMKERKMREEAELERDAEKMYKEFEDDDYGDDYGDGIDEEDDNLDDDGYGDDYTEEEKPLVKKKRSAEKAGNKKKPAREKETPKQTGKKQKKAGATAKKEKEVVRYSDDDFEDDYTDDYSDDYSDEDYSDSSYSDDGFEETAPVKKKKPAPASPVKEEKKKAKSVPPEKAAKKPVAKEEEYDDGDDYDEEGYEDETFDIDSTDEFEDMEETEEETVQKVKPSRKTADPAPDKSSRRPKAPARRVDELDILEEDLNISADSVPKPVKRKKQETERVSETPSRKRPEKPADASSRPARSKKAVEEELPDEPGKADRTAPKAGNESAPAGKSTARAVRQKRRTTETENVPSEIPAKKEPEQRRRRTERTAPAKTGEPARPAVTDNDDDDIFF